MGDIQELVDEARREWAATVRLARRQLVGGSDVAAVQAAIDAAIRHLEDVEAYTLLAASGDPVAEGAIRTLVDRLREIRQSLGDQDD